MPGPDSVNGHLSVPGSATVLARFKWTICKWGLRLFIDYVRCVDFRILQIVLLRHSNTGMYKLIHSISRE